MKKSSLVSLIGAGTVLLFAGVAVAQGAPAVNPGAPPAPRGAAAPAPAAAAPRGPAGQGVGAAGPTTPVVTPRGAATPAPGVAPAPGGPGLATAPAAGGSIGLEGVTERTLPDRAPPTIEGLEPEPGGLTPSEVSRRAIAVRPSLKMKRAQLRAADEKITQTMIQFFPKLTFQAGYTRLSPVVSSFGGSIAGTQGQGFLNVKPCPTTIPNEPTGDCIFAGQDQVAAKAFNIPTVQDNYTLSGRLAIPLSDYVLRVADASASSTASRDAARVAVEAERLKVDADSRALYFNWLRARGQASIARKSVEQTRARLEDAKASFTVGAISKAELLRIQALVANTELVLTRSESMVALTNGQLAIVMEDWHPNYHVGEGIPLPSTIPEETEPLDRLIAAAQTRRLEVQAMDATVKAYRRGGDATRAGALPRLDATGDLTAANPNQRYFPPQQVWHTTWSVGLLASWTVGDTFLNSAAARELEQNAIAAEAQRVEVKAGIALEVLSSYLDLARARAGLVQQRTALDAAEEAYRVTTDLFRAGRATGTDLIAAESGLLDAKLGEVNARIDLTLASIALRHATGRDVVPSSAEAKN